MKKLFLGKNPARFCAQNAEGRQVVLEGQKFYCIENCDRLRPFFMTIVSSADHWMFISSNGALTAGRRHPDLALFPYYTDDKIHDSVEITGPKTILIADKSGGNQLWEPFSDRGRGIWRVKRNLHKSFSGDKILFEEINEDLRLAFRYSWESSEEFGWVRKASLVNFASKTVKVRLLDGLQNLLPCGISSQFQLEKSTLIDAYKKNELLPESGLGLFLLSSVPIDRPEPAESLRANTVWAAGIKPRAVLLSAVQLENFRRGLPLKTERDVRAERGAYFIECRVTIGAGRQQDWMMAADVDQSPSKVARLRQWLRSPARLQRKIEADIARGSEEIQRIAARADGLQKTARPLSDARHFNNTLFNVMRGGVFFDDYRIDAADLLSFVRNANRALAARHAAFFRKVGNGLRLEQIVALARAAGDADLERLCCEYLPLAFSRRHGDPSRPWNRFAISSRDDHGRRILNYEGNWRDIFQNWEALAVSFPGFAAGMVCKFVNSSTADGYNPYRITRDGFDWEVPDPHDPWSHIGYWGDHQIIYLLKLMEIVESHEPGELRALLTREIFSFANVPYRIKPFAQLLSNPRETVEFDPAQEAEIRRRMLQTGSDGKLVWDDRGRVCHVNLAEKLIISQLAKFANFIPGAGIWLNTQRPEWNDANNALVGNGASMVTLYHLHRHLLFCRELFHSHEAGGIRISDEVAEWFSATAGIFKRNRSLKRIGDRERRDILEALGRAGGNYRAQIYTHGFSGRKSLVGKKEFLSFFDNALLLINECIRVSHREDGLYHSYNLVEFSNKRGIPVRGLQTMLEGQAAILGANVLSPEESLNLLTALKRSNLYRADQHSYLLYPDRQLPRFVEKNNLPVKFVASSRLLRKLVADENRLLIERDVAGICHFNPRIVNASILREILSQLSTVGYARQVGRESSRILELYEKMFEHRAFTGRSGTFFGYEGLGCIYWHMVSKLLFAAQESFFRATGTPVQDALAKCYHDIRAGIGDLKTPTEYGAFPMDPYSHTPAHSGARQPGLTGQVKEDILCRFGELGVSVQAGRIQFKPRLLREDEFIKSPDEFRYFDVDGCQRRIQMKSGCLAFTYCQVPVIYRLSSSEFITIEFTDGEKFRQDEPRLDKPVSAAIFQRTGQVKSIICGVNPPHRHNLDVGRKI